MKKSFLYYISPCILAAVISLIATIIGFAEKQSTEGWSFLLVIIFLPALFLLLLVDFLVKLVIKENVLSIWIMEAVFVAIMIICFKLCFYS